MSENKRFTEIISTQKVIDNLTGKEYDCLIDDELLELLNEFAEENQQIKDLIHTILRQIDTENITSDSAKYSARIIFNRNEFNLIRKLWEKELEK